MNSLRKAFTFPTIAPSILAADYSKLESQMKEAADAGVKWFHCDIMDGHFVPNISFGPMIVEAARKCVPESFLDVHLMISNPDQYIGNFADAGADLITVHIEADVHIHRTLTLIKEAGIKCGVAINPGTSLSMLDEILSEVDLVCVMSVNPGFGGQSFIPSTMMKIARLAEWRRTMKLDFLIEVDGGVGEANAETLSRASSDVLVAGSSVFGKGRIPDNLEALFHKAIIGHSELA
jgi:ribulose-phosphate 3-epimerase